MEYVPVLARWLHFLAGIMWIGLLYYFNFVQVPALKAASADATAAGITRHVAPRALAYEQQLLAGLAPEQSRLLDSVLVRLLDRARSLPAGNG